MSDQETRGTQDRTGRRARARLRSARRGSWSNERTRLTRRDLKLSLRGSVERASSTQVNRLKKSRTESVEDWSGRPKSAVEPRTESRVVRDSSRPLIEYIPSIVNTTIVCRISVRLIYEQSSTNGTCVRRTCIKVLSEHIVCT